MKIKTLSYLINNAFGNKNSLKEYRAKKERDGSNVSYVKVWTNEEIDKDVNKHLTSIQNLKDVLIDYVKLRGHNNGGNDTVEMRVVIIYE